VCPNTVHDYNECDWVVEETEKKAKAEQLVLFAKATGLSRNSAKKNKKGKSVDKSKKPKVWPSEPSAIHMDRKDIGPLSVPINWPKGRMVCYGYRVGLWLLSAIIRQWVVSRQDDGAVEQRYYNAVMHWMSKEHLNWTLQRNLGLFLFSIFELNLNGTTLD